MTRKTITYVKTIDYLERLNLSHYGNPRFRIHWTDGSTSVTQSDAGFAYGLENRENIGTPLLVSATPAGRVWGVKPFPRVPEDFPVQPLKPGQDATDPVTCGTCTRTWDDAVATSWTPTPSGRCPFEYFHLED